MTLLQVVGGSGAFPIVIFTILDQSDSPCVFLDLHLKYHFFPVSNPVTITLLTFVVIVFVSADLSKYSYFSAYSTSYDSAPIHLSQLNVTDVADDAFRLFVKFGFCGIVATLSL